MSLLLCVCSAIAIQFLSFVFGFCVHGEDRLNNNDACWGMHWNIEFCGVNAWEGIRRKDSVLLGTSKLLFLVCNLFYVTFHVLS